MMSVSIIAANFNEGFMWLELSDGRILGIPLALFPALRNASAERLADFELSPHGIHWDALDEDLSLKGLLTSIPLQS